MLQARQARPQLAEPQAQQARPARLPVARLLEEPVDVTGRRVPLAALVHNRSYN